MLRLLPSTTLFPYTTLFRSRYYSQPLFIKQACMPKKKFKRGIVKAVAAVKKHIDTHPGDGNSTAFLASQHRSEEHTSELQSRLHRVCRLLLERKKKDDYEPK